MLNEGNFYEIVTEESEREETVTAGEGSYFDTTRPSEDEGLFVGDKSLC